MRFPLEIDGVDFSACANKFDYSVERVEITGPNAGYNLLGEEIPDVLARKWVITWPLNGLTGEELAAILTACDKTVVKVKFWNAKLNDVDISYFRPKLSKSDILVLNSSQKYWSGPVLTLKEK